MGPRTDAQPLGTMVPKETRAVSGEKLRGNAPYNTETPLHTSCLKLALLIPTILPLSEERIKITRFSKSMHQTEH